MKKIKVYIAGPLNSSGIVSVNIKNALDVMEALWRKGHIPICPHLNFFWEVLYPKTYEEIMPYDIELVKICDCILRLPGKSRGADMECEVAKSLGMPIYYNTKEVEREYIEAPGGYPIPKLQYNGKGIQK
jgi:nucleoside 2-deoxyribosyltransferase